MKVSYGAMLIAKERTRQVEEEGWTAAHDNQHQRGELAMAGACYAFDYLGDAFQDDGCDQGKDWEYYETDPDWWALRLWTRRN